MGKKNYLFLMLFVISSNFIVFPLLTSIQSENITNKEIKPSLKSSSFENFGRIIDEYRVNYNTDNFQRKPSICALSTDIIAVAWQSDCQDYLNTAGVYARVFNAKTGNNITREFRVNDYTTGDQTNNSICALSKDKFAVAWDSEGQDSGTYGVYARVFNATTGNNITREFRVNYYTQNGQFNPSICALSNDKFAIAWESNGQDGSGYGVYATIFNTTTGNNITREFCVNFRTDKNQAKPSICALSNDKFAVAWESEDQDNSGYGVYATIFNATTGNNITREFRANYFTTFDQTIPSICALSTDTIAVAWDSYNQDGSNGGVYVRIFNATTGNNITREFRANYYTDSYQTNPSVCALSTDTIAVSWDSYGQIGNYEEVYARLFDANNGNSITPEIQINQYTIYDQHFPSICFLSTDTIALAWQSHLQDGSGYSVYASIFGSLKMLAGISDNDDDDDNGKSSSILDKILNFIKTPIGIGIVVGRIIVLLAIIVIIKKRSR